MEKPKIYFTNIPKVLLALLQKARINWGARSSGDIKLKSKNTLDDREYYTSIETLPLANWIKCTDGKLEYTRKGSTGSKTLDREAWEKIYDEYINEYGLGKLKMKLLKTMVKKAEAELDFCLTGDRFKLTQAEVQETALENMIKNAGHGSTIEQALIHLSKWIGHWIKAVDISTKEYFTMISELDKYNKALKTKPDGKENK